MGTWYIQRTKVPYVRHARLHRTETKHNAIAVGSAKNTNCDTRRYRTAALTFFVCVMNSSHSSPSVPITGICCFLFTLPSGMVWSSKRIHSTSLPAECSKALQSVGMPFGFPNPQSEHSMAAHAGFLPQNNPPVRVSLQQVNLLARQSLRKIAHISTHASPLTATITSLAPSALALTIGMYRPKQKPQVRRGRVSAACVSGTHTATPLAPLDGRSEASNGQKGGDKRGR